MNSERYLPHGPQKQQELLVGNCAEMDPETMVGNHQAQLRNKHSCLGCPVVVDCFVQGAMHKDELGVRGGFTQRERRALQRERPNLTPIQLARVAFTSMNAHYNPEAWNEYVMRRTTDGS